MTDPGRYILARTSASPKTPAVAHHEIAAASPATNHVGSSVPRHARPLGEIRSSAATVVDGCPIDVT